MPYHIPMAYIQQWHLSVQHQFGGNTMLEVAYVGVHCVKLADPTSFDSLSEAAIQQVIAAGGISVNVNPYRPYPQYTGITLQPLAAGPITMPSRLRSRRTSHTVCGCRRTIPGATLWTPTPRTAGTGPNRTFRSRRIRGLLWELHSGPRNTWNGQFVYELPFGQGRSFLNRGGILNGFLGGWRLSDLFTTFSGSPFSPLWGGGGADFAGAGTWYPNRTCNGALSNPTITEWFNPNCFPTAALGTYGNSGRHVLYGPAFFNMNAALEKNSSFAGWVKRERSKCGQTRAT